MERELAGVDLADLVLTSASETVMSLGLLGVAGVEGESWTGGSSSLRKLSTQLKLWLAGAAQ